MSIGKGLAVTTLQVVLEVAGFGFVDEGEVADQSPGAAVDRRLVLSGIVTGESRAKVVGESDVVTVAIDCALEDVHVVHGLNTAKLSGPGKAAAVHSQVDGCGRGALRVPACVAVKPRGGGTAPTRNPPTTLECTEAAEYPNLGVRLVGES